MKNLRILLAAILFVFAACEKEVAPPVTVEFKSGSYQLNVGQTLDLSGELKVVNSNKKPSFSSSDAAVVTVDRNGKVTAVAQGTATVRAEVEGVGASCSVTVSAVKAGNIVLTAPETVTADDTWVNILAEVGTAGYDKNNLVWTFTPSTEALQYETEKVNSSSYKVRFKAYIEGATLQVKVADKNSDACQTAVIAVAEKVITATKISLSMPEELTEGEVWASVVATVAPEDYKVENLVWTFTPTSEALGFKSEMVSATEYKVCFTSYVEGGSVTVKVSDGLSEVFNQGRIKVLKKPVTGLTKLLLSPSALALNVGDDPVALQVSYEPEDYDTSLLEWTTSNAEVATVAAGVVTVKGVGEAVIKIKDTVSGKEAECAVTVTEPVKDAVVTRIDISKVNLDLRVGEDVAQLTATCYDEDGNLVENYADLEWSATQMETDNGKVTVVEVSQQGVVTPKRAGSALVYVVNKKNTNVKAVCNVSVWAAEVKVEEIRLEPSSKTIEVGQKFSLTTLIIPDNAENKTVTYTSSNEAVATVDASGTVTAVATGEAVITATAANGVKGTSKVTVVEGSWVVISSEEITLTVGGEATLTATVKPDNAPDKTVTWSSSAPEVASVDAGKVTAIKEGTAVITATAANGSKAECKVNVESAVVEFEISLSSSDQSLETKGLMQDKSVTLYAQYIRKKDGKDHTPASTKWVSSDETIATVDSEGKVTAVIEHIETSGFENGKKVTITHIADDKEKSIEITVVKALPEQVILTAVPSVNGQEYKMMHGDTFTFKAKVLPEKARQDVWFQGTDPASSPILYLDNNTLTAKIVGYYTFTAYASDNSGAKCNFSIEVLPIPLTDIRFSNTKVELNPGGQASIAVTFVPENASYQNLTWTSSDEAVALVDDHGVVTAVAAGTAVITATQQENGIVRTCEVTVTETASAGPAVGDYYYSDGTTSSALDDTKTVVGVVFSVNNPGQMGDSKLAADFPGCTHGYVISTIEYTDQDFGSVSAYNGHGYYNGVGYDGNAIVDTDKANGYGNTSAHKALNESKPDYCKMFNAADGVIAVHTASVAAPSGASSWYVPSYKEMQMLVENLSAVNEAIAAAGGTSVATPYDSDNSLDDKRSSDWYWSSTIHGTWYNSGKTYDHAKYPFDLSRNGWTATQQSFAKCRVRVVFAF